MSKIHMAVCVGDKDYQKRLTDCLFLYYRKEIEVSAFSHPEQMAEGDMEYQLILCGDCEEEMASLLDRRKEPVVYLVDHQGNLPTSMTSEQKKRVHFLEKYQSIDALVSEALSLVEGETLVMKESMGYHADTKVAAVYALSDVEMQLGYVTTLASVLAEKAKVLVLDLQENSGYKQLEGEHAKFGLEELMVMAESGAYSAGRIRSCISHHGNVDMIAPKDSSECISEGNGALYEKVLDLLKTELDYDWVILSIGSRFMGFFTCLGQCNEVHLLGRKSGLSHWREEEFREEVKKRGYGDLLKRIKQVEVPATLLPAVSCERLVEEWKWNELGDMIRGEVRFG